MRNHVRSRRFKDNFPRKVSETGKAIAPIPRMPRGSRQDEGNQKMYKRWGIGILVFLVITILLLLVVFFLNMRAVRRAKETESLKAVAQSPSKSPPIKVMDEAKPEERHSELVFFVEKEEWFKLEDLLEAAADLHTQGLWSSLYMVQLKNNAMFAVKRLKKLVVSFEEFGLTMGKVGNLKHQNILPLVGYNSTDEEKLLIYRYQRNGSLLTLFENYIEGKRNFPWKLRLSIAAGIARGLEFHIPKI
ncbi:Inactive leucine-rich repeat receptor-like serine/threonine-protein kinase [Abeliophyllum distichum]|uniref:Inactive leucine-rich repeat receptor-like serine/threonine-protein kinase n=1 Tax=Abeliophyllum distichum TaxID=126358 RepID=A0ABD1PU76_9LAMI